MFRVVFTLPPSRVRYLLLIDIRHYSLISASLLPRDPLLRAALTGLTVLTLTSLFVLTLIILVPVRPSRENVISMPSVRRNVCARRSRPASARGFLAHAAPPRDVLASTLRAQPQKL
jgi:hypothetical protein